METKSVLYPNFSSEISSLQNVFQAKRAAIVRGEAETKTTSFYEISELLDLASAFTSKLDSIETAGAAMNPVAVYDSVSTIKELSELSMVKYVQMTPQLTPFLQKAQAASDASADLASFQQANSNLFNYFNLISEMEVASETMMEITWNLNANPSVEAEMTGQTQKSEADSESKMDKLRGLFGDLKNSIDKVVDGTATVIGEAGKQLKDALTNLGSWLNNNVISKFIAAFKWLAEKFNDFKLMLFERTFDFVSKVVELAEKKGWKIKEIAMDMPEFGVDMTDVFGVKIPIPKIKEPPVKFTFTKSST
jgi:hypothetical protein